jgi:hypothetical protein
MIAMLVLFGVWILLTVVLVNTATLEAKPGKETSRADKRGPGSL